MNYYSYLFKPTFTFSASQIVSNFAHTILLELVPSIQHPSKKLDKKYSGQYDFFLPPAIRIEVKASRAVEFDNSEYLYNKALSSNSKKPFDMDFQQIKPGCCDVFVWLAAWRDVIRYWVLPSHEIENNAYYSKGNIAATLEKANCT